MAFSSLLRSVAATAALTVAVQASPALSADKGNPQATHIVAIGGTITEILYDLGVEDRIAARDSTSYFPAAAMQKPDVGYMRALSAEGVLGQKPDLILMEEGAGPPPAIEILKASAVPVVVVPTPLDTALIGARIRTVGAAVGAADKAEALASQTEAGLHALGQDVSNLSGEKKRVLFVLSVANGRLMAGGKGTAADEIIALAGGTNAAASINGYKPLSDEAVIAARPDVVLTMQTAGDHRVTPEAMFALPSMQTTPAAQNKALISMDGLLLLGLGPRTPEAARTLATQLYPGVIN